MIICLPLYHFDNIMNLLSLEHLINEMFFEETPTDTQINDLLWFDTEWLFKQLNIREE